MTKKLNMGTIFQGRSCYRMGLRRSECPHAWQSDDMKAWQEGWDAEASEDATTQTILEPIE